MLHQEICCCLFRARDVFGLWAHELPRGRLSPALLFLLAFNVGDDVAFAYVGALFGVYLY